MYEVCRTIFALTWFRMDLVSHEIILWNFNRDMLALQVAQTTFDADGNCATKTFNSFIHNGIRIWDESTIFRTM